MADFERCVNKGGLSCLRQGGDGSLFHSKEYTHPYMSTQEVGRPVGDFVEVQKATKPIYLSKLFSFFDEDLSKSVLSTEITPSVTLAKSLYDFDLDTEEGVYKVLGLLPIMDPEILSDIVEEIWPGYVADDVDPDLMRAEIKGYLLDYLDSL